MATTFPQLSLDSLTPVPLPSSHPSPENPTTSPTSSPVEPLISRQEHFVLLEDLTGGLHNLYVLDLKMGTRQYGINATAAKKKSQRKKCDQICGMQVLGNFRTFPAEPDKECC